MNTLSLQVRRLRTEAPAELKQAPPHASRLLLAWFTWYCRRYLRAHFHSLRVSRSGPCPEANGQPLVFFLNHASWWDPLLGLVLKDRYFPERCLFAPIDAAMLNRYRMFRRLGFFGVEQNSTRGAIQFLRAAESILQDPNTILGITPQGRFTDTRERPVRFQPGLGHLAARAHHAVFLPVATEFVFWEERLPEILVRFGPPITAARSHPRIGGPESWTEILEDAMTATQNALATEVQRRNPADFESILQGGAGQGGIYDAWRMLSRRIRGQPFQREHGLK